MEIMTVIAMITAICHRSKPESVTFAPFAHAAKCRYSLPASICVCLCVRVCVCCVCVCVCVCLSVSLCVCGAKKIK